MCRSWLRPGHISGKTWPRQDYPIGSWRRQSRINLAPRTIGPVTCIGQFLLSLSIHLSVSRAGILDRVVFMIFYLLLESQRVKAMQVLKYLCLEPDNLIRIDLTARSSWRCRGGSTKNYQTGFQRLSRICHQSESDHHSRSYQTAPCSYL